MKILIVSGCFYPEVTPRAFRTTELACELSRRGHDVTVIAPLHGDGYDALQQNTTPMQLINIQKSWRFLRPSNNRLINLGVRIVNRSLNLFVDYPTIELKYKVARMLRQLKDQTFDLLISIAQPHAIHWGVDVALRRNPSLAKTWVADCGDPYMGCKTDTFKKPFYFKYLEKSFCRRCDFVTVPIAEAIPSYYPEFHDKIKVIPQGFDFSAFIDEHPVEPTNEHPTFVFAGTFIPGIRDPRPLLNWLATQTEVEFRFHIFTGSRELVKEYQSKLGEKLIIHSFVPRTQLLGFMKACDFLVNLENGTAVQSPSKLIDYSLCRRPILSLNSNDMNYIALEEFLRGDYHRQLPPLDIAPYDIRNVTNQFLSLSK